MTSDYLCNLIIPGAAKSGTSSLHEYLSEHPLISMSYRKEPHHFSRDELYVRGGEAHNILFDKNSIYRYYGESSTGYLPWGAAADRVAKDLNNPKIIMVLRHPIKRSFSHYCWRYRLGLEKRSFLEAVKQDGFGYHPDQPDKFGYMGYLEFSKYATHCPVWIEALGKENCLLISSDTLLNDTEAALQSCFRFLGLPGIKLEGGRYRVNETSEIGRRPPEVATRLMRILPNAIRSSPAYQFFRNGLLKVTAPTPPTVMTPDERAFIERELADDIAWFESNFGNSC
jgi:hypothetical protein